MDLLSPVLVRPMFLGAMTLTVLGAALASCSYMFSVDMVADRFRYPLLATALASGGVMFFLPTLVRTPLFLLLPAAAYLGATVVYCRHVRGRIAAQEGPEMQAVFWHYTTRFAAGIVAVVTVAMAGVLWDVVP
ncbi:MAG: hypothetical protein ACT4PT_04550 [Methanobacteriota archaeon]